MLGVAREPVIEPRSPGPQHDITTELAAIAAGAAVIHFGMVPLHADISTTEAFAFAIAGCAQMSSAVVLEHSPRSSRALLTIAAGNAVIVAVWLLSRTTGLPFGASSSLRQEIGLADGLATALEVVLVAGCLWARRRLTADHEPAVSLGRRLLPLLVVLALASFALIRSSGHAHDTTQVQAGAAGHGGHGSTQTAPAAAGHGHGHPAPEPDASRCDQLRQQNHQWSADVADALTTLGCNSDATAAAAGSGDPTLDDAPFVDRLVEDVDTRLRTLPVSLCSAPNLPPDLMGTAEGLVFHFASSPQYCTEPAATVGRVALATYPSRFGRDAAARSDGFAAPVRWVYGRFVIAVLSGSSPDFVERVESAMSRIDGAVAVDAR